MPASAITSASPTLAQVIPWAPAASWRWAMAGGFVRLGVRPEVFARCAEVLGEPGDVVFERVEIDQEDGGVDGVAGHADVFGSVRHSKFHIPQMVMVAPRHGSVCRNTFSDHALFASRSKMSKCPSSLAPYIHVVAGLLQPFSDRFLPGTIQNFQFDYRLLYPAL